MFWPKEPQLSDETAPREFVGNHHLWYLKAYVKYTKDMRQINRCRQIFMTLTVLLIFGTIVIMVDSEVSKWKVVLLCGSCATYLFIVSFLIYKIWRK